jgi:hypothetical protein
MESSDSIGASWNDNIVVLIMNSLVMKAGYSENTVSSPTGLEIFANKNYLHTRRK